MIDDDGRVIVPQIPAHIVMPGCPACMAKRRHKLEDWRYHPQAGGGFTKEGGGWKWVPTQEKNK